MFTVIPTERFNEDVRYYVKKNQTLFCKVVYMVDGRYSVTIGVFNVNLL